VTIGTARSPDEQSEIQHKTFNTIGGSIGHKRNPDGWSKDHIAL
jgi:hypothetical protein